MTTPLQRPL
ncbi:hypothetical protein ECEC96038_2317, partial [Escherichia coli EC96038]